MLNKALLTRKINKATDLPLTQASTCVDVIFDAIADAITRGERIELRGFGSFFTKQVAQKKHPSSFSNQTVVPSHGRISFRPSQKLKLAVWNKVKT